MMEIHYLTKAHLRLFDNATFFFKMRLLISAIC